MRHIGKYEILGLLGKGGMGRVYKVRLPVAGRVLALKLLAPDETLSVLLGDDEIERRFAAEAALLGGLRHPRLAAVTDFDRDERGRPFYCMEFYCQNLGLVLGETYHAEEAARALPVDTAVRLALELLDGLALLHEAGILHRDLKPFNVMLDDEDHVRLIDFGLSARRGERHATPSGMAVGTPFYTAPEQEADPDNADERADLYSVGVICWRMFTGRLPAERADERRRASSLEPGLLEAFDDFLARAVHPEPGSRFQTAPAMAQALRDAHRDWRAALSQVCSLLDPTIAPETPAPPRPRAEPRTVRAADASAVFPLDHLSRPAASSSADFEPAAPGTVLDRTTGLCWQQSGSHRPLDWAAARAYCSRLNERRFAGRTGWRLPTVDELAGIVGRAPGADGYCLDPVFDRAQRRLWTADRKSMRSAWFADAILGYVSWLDADCLLHVRAVCPTHPEGTETA
ncbi:serine/threonine protein kinase [Desulfovibrio sp. X2]|uniref:protein kinase domain-containing protein n=1 Tax=Desulfovibrio sp. X2 TaxID=941449 RepID=UPI000358B53A|nr:DUF1566 domain-containing protein [Desulfovibrio sp. X2]EPR39985.1 serine/threonine protein kinase [Desulfovibrio sp. X2]